MLPSLAKITGDLSQTLTQFERLGTINGNITTDAFLIFVGSFWGAYSYEFEVKPGETVTLAHYLVVGFGPCTVSLILDPYPYGDPMSGNSSGFLLLFLFVGVTPIHLP